MFGVNLLLMQSSSYTICVSSAYITGCSTLVHLLTLDVYSENSILPCSTPFLWSHSLIFRYPVLLFVFFRLGNLQTICIPNTHFLKDPNQEIMMDKIESFRYVKQYKARRTRCKFSCWLARWVPCGLSRMLSYYKLTHRLAAVRAPVQVFED